jgi:hypothetical protein
LKALPGLVHLIASTRVACGAEAAPVVEPFLLHEHRFVRETAADALAHVAGPDTERALRTAWWTLQDDFTRNAISRTLERIHWRTLR